MQSTKLSAKIQSYLDNIFDKQPIVRDIVVAIDTAGGSSYLVGGAVRDLILEQEVKDIDIEIHGLPLDVIELLLRRYGPVDMVGKSFGVLRVHPLDVDWSLPRTDSVGRKPEVAIDPFMGIVHACKRRDLTMNAMAINTISLELIDPYGGQADIHANILRTPDKQFFVEDPLRFYRVMQFIGRFQMHPDACLDELCKSMNLSHISKERISDEFEKLLLKSARPSLGLRWIASISRMQELLPELGALIGVMQDPGWHPEGDAFEHTMQAVDAAAQCEYKDAREKLILMFAALCHDLGKATTTQFVDNRWRSLGHDKAGAVIVKKFLPRISIKKDLIPIVRTLVEYHMHVLWFITENAGPAAYKRLAKKIAPEVTLEMLMMLARADHRARNPQKGYPLPVDDEKDIKLFIERAHNAFVLQQPEPALLHGRDFLDVVSPGPLLGKLVDRAYALQIDQNIQDKDALKEMVLEEYRLGHIDS